MGKQNNKIFENFLKIITNVRLRNQRNYVNLYVITAL